MCNKIRSLDFGNKIKFEPAKKITPNISNTQESLSNNQNSSTSLKFGGDYLKNSSIPLKVTFNPSEIPTTTVDLKGINIKDFDGIDTDSKNDIRFSATSGNATIDFSKLKSQVTSVTNRELPKGLKNYILSCEKLKSVIGESNLNYLAEKIGNLQINSNLSMTSSNSYSLNISSSNPDIYWGNMDMICGNGGIYLSMKLNNNISKAITDLALSILSPAVGLADKISESLTGYSLSNYINSSQISPLISNLLNNIIPNELSKSGLTSTFENGMVKLIPNFKNNPNRFADENGNFTIPLIPSFSVGGFNNLYVEDAKADSLKFEALGNGDLNISFTNFIGVASSAPLAKEVTPEKTYDVIDAKELSMQNNNKEITTTINDLNVKAEIDSTEKTAFSNKLTQLYGNGKNISVEGYIELEVDGKVVTDGKKVDLEKITTKFRGKNINFTNGDSNIAFTSATGNIEFNSLSNLNFNGAFDGKIGKGNDVAYFKDLRLNSNLSIKSDKDSTLYSFNNGNIYAERIALSNSNSSFLNLTNLRANDVKLSLNIPKNSKEASSIDISGSGNETANIENFTLDDKVSYTGNLKNGRLKYDQNGSLHYSTKSSNKINYLGININNTAFAIKDAFFTGKINYDNSKSNFSFDGNFSTNKNNDSFFKLGGNLDLKGSFTGKIDFNKSSETLSLDGKVKDLQGKIGSFNLQDLDASGELELKNGNLSLSNVNNFKLSTPDGDSKNKSISINGNDFSVSMENESYIINGKDRKGTKDDSKVSFNLYNKDDKSSKSLAKNLVFTGDIKYNPTNENISFGGTKESLNIKQGNILGVSLSDFKPSGIIEINKNNTGFSIKSPMSFTGSLSKGAITVKNAELQNYNDKNSSISFDGISDTVLFDGKVSFDLKTGSKSLENKIKGKTSISNEDIFNKFNIDGKAQIKNNVNNIVIESSEGASITTEINGIKLENLKFKGKIIVDLSNPNNTILRFESMDGKEPFNISGKINGKDIDLNTSGKINISNNSNNETEILAIDTKLEGKIADLSLFTKDKELNGKIIIGKDVKIENMTYGIELEGIKLISSSTNVEKKFNGYEIQTNGDLNSSKGNVQKLLAKVSNSSLVTTQEQKNNLNLFSSYLSNTYLENVKLNDSKLFLDKDMSFSGELSIDSGEIKINTQKENNISLNAKSPNDIKIKFNSKGDFSIVSNKATFNAFIDGITLNNLKLNGSINYSTNQDINKIQTLNISQNDKEPIELSGELSIDNKNKPGEKISKNISLKADSEIKLEKNGNLIDISSDNLNIDSAFGDYNVKANTTNTLYEKGKITLNENGSIDLSNLPFDFDVEGIKLSNNSMSFSSANSDKSLQTNDKPYFYELNIEGNANTNIDKFIGFLGKISNEELTPEYTKVSIKQTIEKLQKFLKQGDISTDYDIKMGLDKNFNIQTFKIINKAKITKAELSLEDLKLTKPIKIDEINLTSTSEIVPGDQINKNSKLYLKEGEVSFNLTDDLRKQMGDSVKEVIIKSIADKLNKDPNSDDFKNLNVEMQSNGDFSLSGSINGLPIVKGVSIKAHTSIENTLLNIEVDKVKLNGIIGGITQFLLKPFLDLKEITAEKLEQGAKEQGNQVYYSGKNKFSIDLKSALSNNTNGNLSLESVSIENGKVSIKYKGEYSSEREYDFNKISEYVDKFNQMFNNKTSKIKDQDIQNFIIQDTNNLSTKEITLSFERMSFSDETLKKLEKKGFVTLMEKMLENSSKPRGEEILKNIIEKVVPKNMNGYLKELKKQLLLKNILSNQLKNIIDSKIN